MSARVGPPGRVVIGAPRAGFSLLLSVVNELRLAAAEPEPPRRALWRVLCDDLGAAVSDGVIAAFERRGLGGRLLFNPNFRRLTGGPRWVDPERPDRVSVRKYIGATGLGDFTLLIRLPIEVLHGDDIVHSHSGAGLWPTLAGFAEHTRLASIRDPFGILASAMFSLNALASEHIQRNYPAGVDEEALRVSLGLGKLSDPLFVNSMVDHMARETRAFLSHAPLYDTFRWEDLIRDPPATIRAIARAAGLPCDDPEALWARISYRNLTGAHRHNYRKGHAKIDGWRAWLVDAHLDALRAAGVPQAMARFGYDATARIAPADHGDFQARVARALERGKPVDEVADRDLYVFAFNKTNIDFSRFGFRAGEWRTYSRMERSCFADPAVERTACDAAETALAALVPLLEAVRAVDFGAADRVRGLSAAFDRSAPAFAGAMAPRFEAARARCLWIAQN